MLLLSWLKLVVFVVVGGGCDVVGLLAAVIVVAIILDAVADAVVTVW